MLNIQHVLLLYVCIYRCGRLFRVYWTIVLLVHVCVCMCFKSRGVDLCLIRTNKSTRHDTKGERRKVWFIHPLCCDDGLIEWVPRGYPFELSNTVTIPFCLHPTMHYPAVYIHIYMCMCMSLWVCVAPLTLCTRYPGNRTQRMTTKQRQRTLASHPSKTAHNKSIA